jgi:hypothetical protein
LFTLNETLSYDTGCTSGRLSSIGVSENVQIPEELCWAFRSSNIGVNEIKTNRSVVNRPEKIFRAGTPDLIVTDIIRRAD